MIKSGIKEQTRGQQNKKKIYIVYRKTETLQKTKSGQQIFFLKCPALRLPKDAPILISKRERERRAMWDFG